MYRPTKIMLENFGSHRKTEYNYPVNKPTIITGINETDEGQKSNGSGKSFLLEGLAFAILGSSFRKVKDSELIFYGEKSAFISLSLYSEVKKETLLIERTLYANTKSSELKVFINDVEKTDLTSVLEANKYILAKIGLSREDLLNYFLISKEKYVSFFNSSDTDKKNLINRFSKAHIIDPIIEDSKQDIKNKETEIAGIERNIISLESKIEAYKEQSATVVNNDDKIFELQTDIDTNLSKVKENNTTISSLEKELVELRNNKKQYIELKEESDGNIKELSDNIKEYEAILDEADRNLRNAVECPKCKHEFSLRDKDIDLNELTELKKEASEGIKDLLFAKTDIEKSTESLEDDIKELKQSITDKEYRESRLKNSTKQLMDSNKYLEQQIKHLKEDVKDNVGQSIANAEKSLKEANNSLKSARKELSKLTEWEINFRRFKSYLANQSLSAIEGYANYYLEQLRSNISIRIEGFKEVGKKVSEKINTVIYKNGVEYGNFYKLSGGEKARVEVAVILAMQKLINMSTEDAGLNFIELDEILDSIDGYGLEILTKSLDVINVNMHLVSQVDIQLDVENQIFIKKIDGVSEIVEAA